MIFAAVSSISLLYLLTNFGPISTILKATKIVITSRINSLYYSQFEYNENFIAVPYFYRNTNYLSLVDKKRKPSNLVNATTNEGHDVTKFIEAISGPNGDFNGIRVTPKGLGMTTLKIITVNEKISLISKVFADDEVIYLNSDDTNQSVSTPTPDTNQSVSTPTPDMNQSVSTSTPDVDETIKNDSKYNIICRGDVCEIGYI